MDINVNLKVTFDETPALLNCLAALAESLQRICAVTAEAELLPANPPETGKNVGTPAPAEPAPAAPAQPAVPAAPARVYTLPVPR